MNKSLIIFDFDGVIVVSNDLRFSIDKSHNPDLTYKEWQAMGVSGNYKIETKDKLTIPVEDFFSEYSRKITNIPPFQGIPEIIEELARDNSLFIITQTPSNIVEEYLAHYKINQYFTSILGAELHKPKAERLALLLEEYGEEPAETLFITDTVGDVNEAKRVEVPTIAVTWGQHDRETLERSKPEAVVNTPAEILEYR